MPDISAIEWHTTHHRESRELTAWTACLASCGEDVVVKFSTIDQGLDWFRFGTLPEDFSAEAAALLRSGTHTRCRPAAIPRAELASLPDVYYKSRQCLARIDDANRNINRLNGEIQRLSRARSQWAARKDDARDELKTMAEPDGHLPGCSRSVNCLGDGWCR